MKKQNYQQPQIEIMGICVEQGFGASNEGPGFTIYNQDELGGVNGNENIWAN